MSLNKPKFRISQYALIASGLLALAACGDHPASPAKSPGATPAAQPAKLADAIATQAAKRIDAAQAPLSAAAQLGKQIFFDATLSASGKMSCASCHSPARAYAPDNALPAQMGGPDGNLQGGRAVPSLTYRERTPPFAIGPDLKPDDDERHSDEQKAVDAQLARAHSDVKVAGSAKANHADGAPQAVSQEVVPQGGLDWDGRAAILAVQAGGPLLDPKEMANASPEALLRKLRSAAYADEMRKLFGPGVFSTSNLALGEAYFALSRFMVEDRSFHPYDSKYDYYLAGRVALSEAELRGKKLFEDKNKGNCASCHLDKSSKDGMLPPMFTDYQFEALGVPRNAKLLVNRDPHFFDEGLCGPARKDMVKATHYCGLFKTPSLRNVATRSVFFHNGGITSLDDAVRFYVERETHPEKWYSADKAGKVIKYDDLPADHRINVDIVDAPFDRKAGAEPALSPAEISDVVSFLKTLTDGYKLGR